MCRRSSSPSRLPETHVLVRELDVASLGAVYSAMQVERLSRSELDRLTRLIAEHNLPHTSMCADDVVEDVQARTFFECDLMGWRKMH
jgi:hypothetical protein